MFSWSMCCMISTSRLNRRMSKVGLRRSGRRSIIFTANSRPVNLLVHLRTVEKADDKKRKDGRKRRQ